MRSRLLVSNTPAIAYSVADELRRITPRDMTLLSLLDSHRVLTTAQVTALLYSSAHRAWRRSTILYDRGLLDRFRRWVPTGKAPWHWMLGHLGAHLLASINDTSAPRPAEISARRDRLAASPHLDHLIGVNEFFVQLSAHSRTHDDTELVAWLSERQATSACAQVARPDAGGTWREAGSTVEFWLEHDNGTEELARVARKLSEGYAHLLGTRVSRPVLFWFGSSIREQHFVTLVGRATLAQLRVATTNAELASVNHGPSGKIWSFGGDPRRVGLAQLASPDGVLWDA